MFLDFTGAVPMFFVYYMHIIRIRKTLYYCMKATENLELPRCALRLCYWPRNLKARPGCQCRLQRGRAHCRGRVLTQVTIQWPETAVCKGQVPPNRQ